jgi:hypothetical protein
MRTFMILIMYHDPELGMYMNTIGLSPDMFAIPWFMTAFTRIDTRFPAN